MSAFLYDLGRAAFRRRRTVLSAWAAVLVVAAGCAGLFGQELDNSFSIPGSESQAAQDELEHIVPQVTGAQAQVIVIPPAGTAADARPVRQTVNAFINEVEKLDLVKSVTSPYDSNSTADINSDDTAALVTVLLTVGDPEVTPEFRENMEALTAQLQSDLGNGATASVGGDAFSIDLPGVGITEAIGLAIAFVVLYVSMRALVAAVMPLITAVIGVGVAVMLIFLATSFATVSSTALELTVMLGLAVGIDYALFVLSRHRDELAAGVDPEDAAGRSIATAGSAVLFAATTVVIALIGLSVPGVPILTVMGLAAATGVVVAGTISVTLTPALLGVFGHRLRPKPRRQHSRRWFRRRRRTHASTPHSFARGWVRAITKWPLITVLVCVGGLLVVVAPAPQIELGLPNGGTAALGTPQRTTFDLVDEYFGPGYNGPLLITADIISSTDPVGLTDDIGGYIRTVPGVALVPLATPDPTGVLAIVQAIPTTGPSDAATSDLVRTLRDSAAPALMDQYGVAIKVTGNTAVAIDVTDQLSESLLPFVLLVVGLSLVLLMAVFRSIVVPITATFGYLLSLGSALGIATWIFVLGNGAVELDVTSVGPVVAFLPIILMGVLFGLAMDYEVFVVSRIREQYSQTGDPRLAIEEGFVSASRVVATAALIMFGVFLSFFPGGSSTIKPLSLGLAVGVFIDAFVVRMTLMPALLRLFGRWTWWLPGQLDRALPTIDIEGAGLQRELDLADWPGDEDVVVAAQGLRVLGPDGPVVDGLHLRVRRGGFVVLAGTPQQVSVLSLALAGRLVPDGGNLRVDGLLLPGRATQLRRRVTLLRAPQLASMAGEEMPAWDATSLVVAEGIDHLIDTGEHSGAWQLLHHAHQSGATVLVGTSHPTKGSAIGEYGARIVDVGTGVAGHLGGGSRAGADL